LGLIPTQGEPEAGQGHALRPAQAGGMKAEEPDDFDSMIETKNKTKTKGAFLRKTHTQLQAHPSLGKDLMEPEIALFINRLEQKRQELIQKSLDVGKTIDQLREMFGGPDIIPIMAIEIPQQDERVTTGIFIALMLDWPETAFVEFLATQDIKLATSSLKRLCGIGGIILQGNRPAFDVFNHLRELLVFLRFRHPHLIHLGFEDACHTFCKI
jgi:hypothetical protein